MTMLRIGSLRFGIVAGSKRNAVMVRRASDSVTAPQPDWSSVFILMTVVERVAHI
jgi:hypothetical protein